MIKTGSALALRIHLPSSPRSSENTVESYYPGPHIHESEVAENYCCCLYCFCYCLLIPEIVLCSIYTLWVLLKCSFLIKRKKSCHMIYLGNIHLYEVLLHWGYISCDRLPHRCNKGLTLSVAVILQSCMYSLSTRKW